MNSSSVKKKFYGEIGRNIPVNRAEKEEDLLEQMYLFWKEGKPLLQGALAEAAGIKDKEFSGYRKRMIRHGYLQNLPKDDEMVLTEFGLSQGAECVYRHKNLTQFLQMISGIEYEKAEMNACRLEHFIDKRILEGIVDFVRFGNVYDQMLKNYDMNNLFDVGNYPVCMSIYEPEKRSPRVLAKEHKWFANEPVMEIREQTSRFLLKPVNPKVENLFYRKDGRWIQTRKRDQAFLLPTSAFEYVVSPSLPTIEGMLLISAVLEGHTVSDAECRELNVHICH